MSFALPFVRAASDDASEARLAGLGLAAVAIFLFALLTVAERRALPWAYRLKRTETR